MSDIKNYLHNTDLDEIAKIYRQKSDKLEEEIRELSLLKNRLDQKIDRLETMSFLIKQHHVDKKPLVELKTLEERPVVSIRRSSPFNFISVTLRTIELFNLFHVSKLQMIDPYMIIFHDNYKNFNVFHTDFEICVGIDLNLKSTQNVLNDDKVEFTNFRTLEAGEYATSIHKGSYEDSIIAYNNLMEWINDNDYEVNGPLFKVYITDYALTKSVKNLVYELQIPVKKKNIG